MDNKKKLGVAAVSLAAAAAVLGTANTAGAGAEYECVKACVDVGPGNSEFAPFHKISAMQKVMQKVAGTPAFGKISELFIKFGGTPTVVTTTDG